MSETSQSSMDVTLWNWRWYQTGCWKKIINKESFDKTKNQHRVIWLNEKAKESPNLSTPGSFDDVLPEPEHWTLDHCVDRPGFEKNGLQNSLLVNLFFSRRMLRFGCTKNLARCSHTWRRAQGRGGLYLAEGPPHLQQPLLPLQNNWTSVLTKNVGCSSMWKEEWDSDNMSKFSHGGSPAGWAPFLPPIGCCSLHLNCYWPGSNIQRLWLVRQFWTLNSNWLCTNWSRRQRGNNFRFLKIYQMKYSVTCTEINNVTLSIALGTSWGLVSLASQNSLYHQ